MRFLIDECLSPALATHAQGRDFEATHVNWLGQTSAKDWDLIPVIEAGDWTFITKNSVDFRGDPVRPGQKGQYTRLPLHAGLICLNADTIMPRAVQIEMFDLALDELGAPADLVNECLEVSIERDEYVIRRYDLPTTAS